MNLTRMDLLRLSAQDLQQLLISGDLTSEALITQCLAQIAKYDVQGPTLRAMISVAARDKLLARARMLDDERRRGDPKGRGPFHGLPIIIKDIISTDPEWNLPTTQGSVVLDSTQADRQAVVVDKLMDAGFIILGKTNLTEFGSAKASVDISGLSALGGRSNSAYVDKAVKEGDKPMVHASPGGSSTGSALGVAAGYSPVSVGGEAWGSISTPASRAALYGLKITPQTLDLTGVFLIAPTFESLGPMAKTVQDVADLTKILLQAAKDPAHAALEYNSDKTSWQGLSLGFVDLDVWKYSDALITTDAEYLKQIKDHVEDAMAKIRQGGGSVQYPTELTNPSELIIDGKVAQFKVVEGEMRDAVNQFLGGMTLPPIGSLAGIISWNEAHPHDQAGLDQEGLIQAQNDTTTPEELARARAWTRETAGEQGILRVMQEAGLDAVCAPTDSPIHLNAAMAGCPSATIPLGYLKPSGRPFGLTIVGARNREDVLLRIMRAFEETLPARRLPPLLK